jgi:hypothetical protein
VSAASGRTAADAVLCAAADAMAGRIDGLVTAPLNKESLHAAGHPWPGHTEMLADAAGVTDRGGPGREEAGAQTAIIATVLNDPSGFVGVNVRVVGLFRGRNLFGDLPADSQRNASDWVLKEDEQALWVTGKAPKGKGWSLDPAYKGDTVRWLAVEGKIEVVNGVAYLRASKVILTRDPHTEAAESR